MASGAETLRGLRRRGRQLSQTTTVGRHAAETLRADDFRLRDGLRSLVTALGNADSQLRVEAEQGTRLAAEQQALRAEAEEARIELHRARQALSLAIAARAQIAATLLMMRAQAPSIDFEASLRRALASLAAPVRPPSPALAAELAHTLNGYLRHA